MADEYTADGGTAEQARDREAEARRQFLKKIGRAGATAPAVALLLAANSRPASAQDLYNGGGSGSS